MSTAKKLPLDTIGGIMQAIADINAEGRKQLKKRRQCPAVHGPSRSDAIRQHVADLEKQGFNVLMSTSTASLSVGKDGGSGG